MDKSGLAYILGRLDKQTLQDLPHHVYPCPNLHKHEVLEVEEDVFDEQESCMAYIRQARQYYKPFPYDSSLPVPIIEPVTSTVEVLNGFDPALNLVKNKLQWEKRKEEILSANKRDIKHIDKNDVKSVHKAKHNQLTLLPRGVAVLASHLADDPDPCFSGKYNWYYSGGNLASLSAGGNTLLLSSTGKNRNTLKQILLGDDGWKSQKTHTITMANNSPIHQVLTTEGFVAVRQKNEVTVLVPEESEHEFSLHLKWLHTSVIDENKEGKFVSASVSPSTDLQYCTLTSGGVVRLWEPSTKMSCISEMKVKSEKIPIDNWGSVHHHDRNTILVLNRDYIYLLDKRTKRTAQTWCHSDLCEVCEDLSMCVASSRQHYLKYIGTSHQVLGLDMRSGFSQRWTHMMTLPPYIGCVTPINTDGELLLLSSQNIRDTVAIVNDCSGDNAESNSFPLSLLSPVEALRLVRQRATCLEPHVKMRCKMSLTGMYCLPRHDSLLLLRQNSLGDVFCQQFQNRKDEFENKLSDHDFQLWKAWGNKCEKAVELPDSVNCIIKTLHNVDKYYKGAMAKKADMKDWSKIYDEKNNSGSKKPIRSWQVSKQYLENCVDELAAKLYNAWEIDDEDEWLDLENEEEEEEEDPTHKVRNWLDTAPMALDAGIPGVEPLNNGGIDGDNVSVMSLLSQKRQLTGQSASVVKKSKLHKTDILDESSVNSLLLPRRNFVGAQSSGLKPPGSAKLHSEYGSDRSYPLTQKSNHSQTQGDHLPKSFTPLRLRNFSPGRYGSEVGSVENASITSKQKLDTMPIVKLSQQSSSQLDMFAGMMSPQNSQLGTDFPVTPHSSQEPTMKSKKPQTAKRKFVPGF